MVADQNTLLVADSFRVRTHPITGHAEVRNWSDHAQRFSSAVRELKAECDVEQYLATAVEQISRFGEGFPRLEVWSSAHDQLTCTVSLRALPALTDSVQLYSVVSPNLVTPEVKGPNIDLLNRLNRELGGEALLLDAHGSVIEGATTTIVWWSDNVLYTAPPQHRVRSVTEKFLLRFTQQRGVAVHQSSQISLRDLQRAEVWALNALHGIRRVTQLDNVALAEPNHTRLAVFRDGLDHSWQPLT